MSNKIKQEMDKIEIPKGLSERSKLGINQAKGKALYYIYLIILIPLSFYIYANLYDNYISWNVTFLAIFLYLIAIIPLMAFVSEKLAKLSLRLGLRKRKYFIVFLVILVAIPVIMTINDYREKDLDDVISFHTNDFEFMTINHQWKTDKKEHAEELKKFLSQYRVKKMKDDEWNSDVSKEKGFRFTIYTEGNPVGASIYENRLVYYNDGDYYKVVNGPIDIDWMKKKYTEEYEEF